MRGTLYLILALVAAFAVMARAEPTISIYADRAMCQPGDSIEVSLSAENDNEAMSVDVYVGLILPDGDIWSAQYAGWSRSIDAWLQDIFVPAWFEMAPTPFWRFYLPSEGPPIESRGYYCLAAVLTYPGSSGWVSNASLAPFAYGLGKPSPDIPMISIPAGSFVMGSLEEDDLRYSASPQRTVNISAFEMSETEVTQRQWNEIMDWDASWFKGDDRPVELVSWFDCVSFCNALSQAHGYKKCYKMTNIEYWRCHIISADVTCDWEADGYRLPTEAEWEYACRAGTTTRYYWGDTSDESTMKQHCWYMMNAYMPDWTDPHASECGTQPVGEKIPNAFGLYDMSGNVWEWCWDWYDPGYYATRPDPDSDPTGPIRGGIRVVRGGSWASEAQGCRCAVRGASGPGEWDFLVGFRVARSD